MGKKNKKPGVPEVFQRLYGKGVMNLGDAILSLIPRPTDSSCTCSCSRPFGCLLCVTRENATTFLLRSNDQLQYRNLLNVNYVIFRDDAPPIPNLYTHNHWSQHKIVYRAIEAALNERNQTSRNVICVGYDKFKRTSPIVKFLTTESWNLLLKRVGDEMMFYLLKYASIFLALPSSKYQQVAGFPISNLARQLLSKNKMQEKRPLDNHFEPTKKRARLTKENVMHHTSLCGKICDQMDAPKAMVSGQKNEELEGSKHNLFGSGKRPWRWQRRRNLQRLAAKENGEKTSCSINGLDGGVGSPKTCPNGCSNTSSSHRHKRATADTHSCFNYDLVISSYEVTRGAEINRQPIFYNYGESSSVLPQKHVLKSLKPNNSGSNFLLQSIFGLSDVAERAHSLTCSNHNGSCPSGSTCLHHPLAKLLKSLIIRARRCKHLKLLDKHCPVPSSFEDQDLNGKGCDSSSGCSSKPATDTQIQGLKSYCSKPQVISFIWAVSRNIVPPDLLGNPSNWRRLRRNIAKFIQLRRYEKFSLKQCMHGLKTTSFPFLSNNRILIEKWIVWFFSDLVVPLLQANFYITETENGKQDIFYYRKSSWEKLKNQTMSCLEHKNYRTLNAAEVAGILKNRSFGFSKVRLVPKNNSMRVVANLKAASRLPAPESSSSHARAWSVSRNVHSHRDAAGQYKHFRPVNWALRDAHAVLRGMRSKEPEKFGSSVFDYNDIYRVLCPFIRSLKRKKSISSSFPDVFIVVSDVSSAFDCVNQDKLLSILNVVMSEDKYLLKQINQVVCTKKSLWVQEKASICDPVNITDTKRCGSGAVSAISTVLVNQGIERRLNRSVVLHVLQELVKRNVLRMGRRFYLQGMGIPQGSIVSSLLCSLYYGHLEGTVISPYLKKTSKPDDPSRTLQLRDCSGNAEARYMLMRLIDDFLMITTSKNQATAFFSRLKSGFKDYNCYMNEDKFCLNFDVEHESQPSSNRIYVGEDGTSFIRWSGLLLNSSTLEIQADYTRYLNNHLSSRLTICWDKRPRFHLEKKLHAFMRPKCHPLFFDSNINTAPIVRLNVFQAFLICAMIFHSYVSEMSYICKLPAKSLMKTIQGTWSYMHRLIKRRMRSLPSSSSLGSCHSPILRLRKTEVHWLAINAYIEALNRKQSRHRVLLSMLRSKLSAHPISHSKDVPPELKYAVDRSNSSLLWEIKY